MGGLISKYLVPVLAGKFGPWIVIGLFGILSVTGWRLYDAGYDRANEKRDALEASEELLKLNAVLDKITENNELQLELNAQSQTISDKLDVEEDVVVERINRVVEKQPIIVTGDCAVDYSTVRLLNMVADGGASRDSDD